MMFKFFFSLYFLMSFLLAVQMGSLAIGTPLPIKFLFFSVVLTDLLSILALDFSYLTKLLAISLNFSHSHQSM